MTNWYMAKDWTIQIWVRKILTLSVWIKKLLTHLVMKHLPKLIRRFYVVQILLYGKQTTVQYLDTNCLRCNAPKVLPTKLLSVPSKKDYYTPTRCDERSDDSPQAENTPKSTNHDIYPEKIILQEQLIDCALHGTLAEENRIYGQLCEMTHFSVQDILDKKKLRSWELWPTENLLSTTIPWRINMQM